MFEKSIVKQDFVIDKTDFIVMKTVFEVVIFRISGLKSTFFAVFWVNCTCGCVTDLVQVPFEMVIAYTTCFQAHISI